jgi:LacI family transcriptional regulator
VTLRDVAREAGVSYATASRALNGSTRTVRQENVSRVEAAAARLGYAPDPSAQAFARGSTATVALVVSDLSDPYFSSIAEGVIDAAERVGLIVTMAVADGSPGLELQIVRSLRGHRPRAMLVAGSRIEDAQTRASLVAELEAYRDAGGAVAMISQADLPFPTVAVDDHGGGRQLALALVDRGYRRFAVLHGDERIRTSTDRLQGFRDGLQEAGVDLDERFCVPVELSRDGGWEGIRVLLERGTNEVELVFAINDIVAVGAMSQLRQAGLQPGRDLAIAGFDDVDLAALVTPALTSVRVPLRRMGGQALQLALAADPAVVKVPTEVVLRDSTPPH